MPMIYYITVIVACGLFATTTMTLFVLLVNKVTGKRLNVIRILGTMLTSQTQADGSTSPRTNSIAAGVTAHYAVGFFFTTVYVIAWQHNWLGYALTDCAVIGLVTGMVGIIVWRIYFAIHRFAPAVQLNIYLTTILIAHIVFGLSAGWIYWLMAGAGI